MCPSLHFGPHISLQTTTPLSACSGRKQYNEGHKGPNPVSKHIIQTAKVPKTKYFQRRKMAGRKEKRGEHANGPGKFWPGGRPWCALVTRGARFNRPGPGGLGPGDWPSFPARHLASLNNAEDPDIVPGSTVPPLHTPPAEPRARPLGEAVGRRLFLSGPGSKRPREEEGRGEGTRAELPIGGGPGPAGRRRGARGIPGRAAPTTFRGTPRPAPPRPLLPGPLGNPARARALTICATLSRAPWVRGYTGSSSPSEGPAPGLGAPPPLLHVVRTSPAPCDIARPCAPPPRPGSRGRSSRAGGWAGGRGGAALAGGGRGAPGRAGDARQMWPELVGTRGPRLPGAQQLLSSRRAQVALARGGSGRLGLSRAPSWCPALWDGVGCGCGCAEGAQVQLTDAQRPTPASARFCVRTCATVATSQLDAPITSGSPSAAP